MSFRGPFGRPVRAVKESDQPACVEPEGLIQQKHFYPQQRNQRKWEPKPSITGELTQLKSKCEQLRLQLQDAQMRVDAAESAMDLMYKQGPPSTDVEVPFATTIRQEVWMTYDYTAIANHYRSIHRELKTVYKRLAREWGLYLEAIPMAVLVQECEPYAMVEKKQKQKWV